MFSRRFVLVAVGLLLMVMLLAAFYLFGTRTTVSFAVERTERVTDARGEGSKYLVWTTGGVFENTDAPLHGKFDSSDLQGALSRLGHFRCEAYGIRVPLLSMYPNLLRCTKTD